MAETQTLRERQAPLKARYQDDPESAKLTITVRSTTQGDEPTRSTIFTTAGGGVSWDVGAHPFAGGEGDLPCSGDVLLASLAACQEITLRMVASAMGVRLESVEIAVHGEMDFRGTMGVDAETRSGSRASGPRSMSWRIVPGTGSSGSPSGPNGTVWSPPRSGNCR